MKTHNPFVSLAILSITALLIAAGCSSSSSPSGTTTNQALSVKPKLGSTFTDSISVKNSSLTNQPGSSVTYTLIDTNATIGGQSGVYVFSDGLDSAYYYYQANGDISAYIDFEADGGQYEVGKEWVTFPFASQDSSSIATLKGFVIVDSVTVTGYTKGTGTSTLMITDTSRYSESATMFSQAVAPALADTIPSTTKATYVPSLGLVTYQDFTQTGTALGQNIGGGQTVFLTSYSLK